MSYLLDNLIVFGRLLRSLGLEVHTGRLLDVAGALGHVDIARRGDVYHTCRTLLVHRQDELDTFERAFDAFWRLQHEGTRAMPGRPVPAVRVPVSEEPPAGAPDGRSTGMAGAGDDASEDRAGGPRSWSNASALAAKDFGEFTAEEIVTARAALDRLVWSPGQRRTRRWVAGRGPRIDLRRALAISLRTGGDVVTLPRRTRRRRPRRLVLICDVSGSMERYSRMLLHFAHAIGLQHQRVEAFLFSTRLTRITPQLRM